MAENGHCESSTMFRVSAFVIFSAYAQAFSFQKASSAWSEKCFNSLITFGDSYTDENRLNWFSTHNGSAPPAGTFLGESFDTAGGGRTWPRYVVQYTGETANGTWEPQMTLYDYAVSGAVCSNVSGILRTVLDGEPTLVHLSLLNRTMRDAVANYVPHST